jgi:hypothetical protein
MLKRWVSFTGTVRKVYGQDYISIAEREHSSRRYRASEPDIYTVYSPLPIVLFATASRLNHLISSHSLPLPLVDPVSVDPGFIARV